MVPLHKKSCHCKLQPILFSSPSVHSPVGARNKDVIHNDGLCCVVSALLSGHDGRIAKSNCIIRTYCKAQMHHVLLRFRRFRAELLDSFFRTQPADASWPKTVALHSNYCANTRKAACSQNMKVYPPFVKAFVRHLDDEWLGVWQAITFQRAPKSAH